MFFGSGGRRNRACGVAELTSLVGFASSSDAPLGEEEERCVQGSLRRVTSFGL